MTGSRRGGFTLVEVIFAVVIVGMLFGILYNIFYSQHATAYKLGAKNEALTSCLVAAEVIQKDLRQLVTVPVLRNADGTLARRFGDHSAPVKVSPEGRNASFYIPRDPGAAAASLLSEDRTRDAVTVVYTLVPATKPGTYKLRRSVIEDEAAMQQATADPSALKGREVSGVLLRDLHFRLLDPKAPAAVYRSPDTNYYLEAVIQGVDVTGKETQTLPVLANLEYPSVLQQTPNIQEVIAYRPLAALVTPPDTLSPSPAEVAAVNRINDATRRFLDGDLPTAEFEREVADLINSLAGQPGGPVVASTGNLVPRVDNLRLAQQPRPGEPAVLTAPNGTNVVVPPPGSSSGGPPIMTVTPPTGNWNFMGRSARFHNGQLVAENEFSGGGDGNVTNDQLQGILNTWMDDQYRAYNDEIARERGTSGM